MDGHREHGHGTAGLGALALGALGIVYGDIGTSPLYALRETFHGAGHELHVTETNVLGVLSLIFWSLLVIISVKYLAFVMRADNEGEGGILALTSLVTPREDARTPIRWVLVLIGLFGTALLYGDGMITPAISVLAAVEGAEVAVPALAGFVIPIAVAILIGLFAIQRRGTATVGRLFGPIMVLWFGVLAALGLPHIVAEPQVFAALNPLHAVRFFGDEGFRGFLALGSVFLVVTGGEALYADMGHFGRRPIQVGWFVVVLPALLLNYFGQGALLLRDPGAIEHPFYRLAPSWGVLPLVVLATMATVIASQALISGVFSLTMQAVQLGYAPRVRIKHTSPDAFGQIYIPAVNWGLLLACIGLVVGFRSSANLAAAYGVAVTATMVITTLLFFVVLRERFQWSATTSTAFCAVMLLIEGGFFGANLFKIPHGGWFPLVIGAIVFTVLTTWAHGRRLVRTRIRKHELTLREYLGNLLEDDPPVRVPGTAIYLFGDPGGVPPALLSNVRVHNALHEHVVILTVVVEHVPRVLPVRRGSVLDGGHGVTAVELHYGFMERPDVPRGLREGIAQTLGIDPYRATYFLGAETIRSTDRPGMARWRERLYVLMQRNAATAADYFHLPPERTISVGLTVEI